LRCLPGRYLPSSRQASTRLSDRPTRNNQALATGIALQSKPPCNVIPISGWHKKRKRPAQQGKGQQIQTDTVASTLKS
jgi:hypothetical protein